MNSSTISSLAPTSIAVVDSAIANVDELLQGITVDHVVTLNAQQSGIAQITQLLSQYNNVAGLHLFAHGDSASLHLGNSTLDASNIGQYSSALGEWGNALQESGDILVYGCNVGEGSDGLSFVQALSQATGADIAASDDLTGQGGDWDLEVLTGTVDTTFGVDTRQLQTYNGTLNLVTNGSFEADQLGGMFESIPGWTATSPGEMIEVQRVGRFLVFDGEARVELDSVANSGMVQSIDTDAGATYSLSFAYSPRPQQAAATNGIEVYWNGQLLDTIAEDGTNLPVGTLDWTVQSYQVDATGTNTDLEFRAVGTSDGLGGLLDAVNVEAIASPPPNTSIQFTDVTALAGVSYTGESHGASWGDVNGDGFVDLWTTNHNSLPTLYINQGDGTFEEDTAFSPVTNTDTHGSAFADFDNDGDQDLIVVTGADFGLGTDENQLYVNENGVLSDRAAELGVDYGFARGRTPLWFDYDNDGKLDLIVSSLFRNDRLGLPTIFRQTDNGFEEVKDETGFNILGSRYNLISDLDRDGQMEVLVNGLDSNFNNGLTIYDTSNPTFANVTSSFLPADIKAEDMVIADFNGDLRPDVFTTRDGRLSGVVQPEPGLADLFLRAISTEQGVRFSASEEVFFDFFFTFELPLSDIFIGSSGINPTSRRFTLSATDPNNQGIVDPSEPGLYIGYDETSGEWQVLLSSDQNFRRLVGSVSTTGTLSNLSPIGFDPNETPLTEQLFINTPQGFVDQSVAAGITLNPTAGESIAAGDFDNDKDIDVYIVGRDVVGNRPNTLYENQGDGTFVEVASAGGAAGTNLGIGEAVAVADYDGDGFLDLFTLNGKEPRPFDLDGENQLFRNVGNDNNWIQFDLEGVVSNRDGIGAQVYVTSGGTTQLREQTGGIHKHAQNHTRLHFGLASDPVIDELRIVWPSGIEQVLTNVDVNQILTITEPNEASPTGNNLLQNSGFENGLTNWNDFSGTESVTTDGFNGTQALQLSSRRSGVNQLVSATPGQTYQLSGYAKTNNNGWNGWGLRFRASDGTVLDTKQVRINTAEWSLYELEGHAPANTARVEVFIWNGGDSGSTALDAVSLQQVTNSGTDTTAPTANLTAGNVTTAGANTYNFTVTYSDNEAIATATLDDTDIQVTGPNGFSQAATLVDINNSSDGSPRTATYQVTTPGGTWDDADNGTYTVALNGNAVSDVNGNEAIATTLGDFTVNIADTPPSTGLLQNPGFETDLTNWGLFTGTETVTTVNPFTGTGALLLTASGSGAQQRVDAVAGETYSLTINGKSDASGWSGFGFNFFDENGVKIESATRRINTSDWDSYFLEAVVPTNAISMGVFVFKGGEFGSTVVDDFVLERL